MKFLPLIWAMLWRSKARTWLTFLSVVVAFLLFGLLQSVGQAFQLGVRLAGDDRIVVTYRQGLTKLLPIAYRSRIEQIDGVMAVQPTVFMVGSYQDPKNQVVAVAIDPNVTNVDPRVLVPEDQTRAFQTLRNGALAGRDLAKQYGWKIGDRITIRSPSLKKDDSPEWEFQLVGFYELDEKQTGRPVPAQNLVINIDHYNEAAKWANVVIWFTVRVHDPKQAGAVAKAIDKEFQNSEFETRTQSEADFQRGFVKQFGNVGKMMTAILAAVFFTLLLVSGNSMMQAYRERVPELAVLKTLGFTDRRVAALVAVEALLLCGLAGGLGLLLTWLVVPPLQAAGGQAMAGLHLEQVTVAVGLALALAVGALSAFVPAWRSARLTVVEGLVQS